MKTMKFSLEKQQVCCEISHAVPCGAFKIKRRERKKGQNDSELDRFFFVGPTLGSQC